MFPCHIGGDFLDVVSISQTRLTDKALENTHFKIVLDAEYAQSISFRYCNPWTITSEFSYLEHLSWVSLIIF